MFIIYLFLLHLIIIFSSNVHKLAILSNIIVKQNLSKPAQNIVRFSVFYKLKYVLKTKKFKGILR